jgi:hypothetical protein
VADRSEFHERGPRDMSSAGKKKTTMAKRERENRLRERRAEKQAKKEARKLASQAPEAPHETATNDPGPSRAGPPVLDSSAHPVAKT